MEKVEVVKENRYKKFSHYKIENIKVGDFIQLELIKPKCKFPAFLSVHVDVEKIDPKGTGKIIGKGYGNEQGRSFLFHVDFIYKNYTYEKKNKNKNNL